MPRKTKETKIRELEKELNTYKEYVERISARNAELVAAEEETFLHSPTYLQMQEEIKFLRNLEKLNQIHLASTKEQAIKADNACRQIYEDNKRLTSEHTDRSYFIGITENWRSAQKYQELKGENSSLQGKIEQKEISIADRDAEIARLQDEIAKLVLEKAEKDSSMSESKEDKSKHLSEKQRNMIDGLDLLMRNVVKCPDENTFTVAELIEMSNEIYNKIQKL